MPLIIPFILWGGAAVVGAYVAWQNRHAIGEYLMKAGEAYERQAKAEVEKLLAMQLPAAQHHVDHTVPHMDVVYWEFFKNELGRHAFTNSVAASLHARAVRVWEDCMKPREQPS